MVRQCVDVSPHSQPTRHTGDVGTLNTDRYSCDLHLKMVFRMRCGSAYIYRKHQTDANKVQWPLFSEACSTVFTFSPLKGVLALCKLSKVFRI